MKTLRAAIACLLLAASAPLAETGEGIAWRHDAAGAEADARKNGKLLLIFITGPET